MDRRIIGDVYIAIIDKRFDAYTACKVEEVLKDQISKGATKIVADFSQTDYIASAGLRVLLSAAKSLHNLGGQIVLSSMKPQVFEIFSVSGFTQIFRIYTSQQEALESLK